MSGYTYGRRRGWGPRLAEEPGPAGRPGGSEAE